MVILGDKIESRKGGHTSIVFRKYGLRFLIERPSKTCLLTEKQAKFEKRIVKGSVFRVVVQLRGTEKFWIVVDLVQLIEIYE